MERSSTKNRIKYSHICIAILIITTASIVFARSYFRALNFDEVIYGFVLDTDEYGGYYKEGLSKKISSISEIVSSQINHYQFHNGRSVVHTMEQLFTGIIGVGWYNALNSILFVLFAAAIIRLSAAKANRSNILLWIILIIILLYLYPEPDCLWFSINLASNYLLPGLLMTAVFIYFEKVNNNSVSKKESIAIVFLSFIFGWSHEVYSLPVLAAFSLYYLRHPREFKHNWWIIVFPIFLGAAIMIAAPGLWLRFFDLDPMNNSGGFSKFSSIFHKLLSVYPLWILIILIFYAIRLHIFKLKSFCYDNKIYLTTIAINILFILIINPPLRGYTAIYILLTYLIIKVLSDILSFYNYKRFQGQWRSSVAGANQISG